MPEITVYEDRYLQSVKRDIGLAWKPGSVLCKPNPSSSKRTKDE